MVCPSPLKRGSGNLELLRSFACERIAWKSQKLSGIVPTDFKWPAVVKPRTNATSPLLPTLFDLNIIDPGLWCASIHTKQLGAQCTALTKQTA
jgi:hypothetical protein